jgi:hypothetical protein
MAVFGVATFGFADGIDAREMRKAAGGRACERSNEPPGMVAFGSRSRLQSD